jgi:hypothetical protein
MKHQVYECIDCGARLSWSDPDSGCFTYRSTGDCTGQWVVPTARSVASEPKRVHCRMCDQWVTSAGPWCDLYWSRRYCEIALEVTSLSASSPAEVRGDRGADGSDRTE